jgi:hypothetical protein
MSARRPQLSRKGTVALRTLRRPTVQVLQDVHINKAAGIPKEKLDLVAEGGLDGLNHLLSYEAPTVQALVPPIVNQITKNDDGEIVLTNEQGWNNLLELCTTKEIDIRRDAMWTVAILAASAECHDYIASVFGWKTIISFAKTNDPEIQIACNILIANLAVNEDNQMQMIAVGGLKILIDQAKSTKDINLKRAVATALSNAVMDIDNAREFVKEGGISLLESFLDTKDEELIQIVISMIANIASSDESDVKTKVAKKLGLKTFVNLLSNKNANVLKGAAVTLGHFAGQEEYQQELWDLKAVDKLVPLLESQDPSTVLGAAMAISNLSQDPKYGKAMYDAGVGAKIKALLKNADSEARTELETASANINLYEPIPEEPKVEETKEEAPPSPAPARRPISEEMSGARLERGLSVRQIEPVEELTQKAADLKVADAPAPAPAVTMESTPAPAPEPAKPGAPAIDISTIPTLVTKLTSKDVPTQKEGASGLVVIVKSPQRDAAVGALGSRGLNELHTVFKSTKDQALLLDVCKVLAGVAATQTRDKIRFAEICPILLNMLTMTLPAQEEALNILPPLLFKNINNQAILMKLNGTDAILSILKTGGSEDIKGRAAKALHALTFQNRQSQATLSKKKALNVLVQLLESSSPLVQKSAAGAIYAAAGGNFANQNELRKANVVGPLTKLLGSSDESVRQTSAGAFYALLLDNKKLQEASNNSIPAFISLLTSTNIAILSNATAAITELIRTSEKTQDLFCTADAGKALVNLLSSADFWVVYNTLSIIGTLLKKKTQKRKEVFVQLKLEAALQPLLNHPQVAIKKEAAKVLSSLK